VLQDGRRFNLDDAGERKAGLAGWLELPRNDAPPAAPPETRMSGGTFGSYDPAAWEGRSAERGRLLQGSPRYQALFARRPQLAALAMGRRVVTTRDGYPDDSDSAQLAVLVSNLLTTGRAGSGGRLVPGLGAPPEDEIRNLALFWQPKLCPNASPEHFRAHVDYEIGRYRPDGYAPEATRLLGQAAAEPPELEAPRDRGRPSGQRAEQAEHLVALLAEHLGEIVTLGALGCALNVGERMVRLYIDDLGERVELARARYGLHVVRVEINSTALADSSLAATELSHHANPAEESAQIGNRSPDESGSTGVLMPKNADQVLHTEEHTAPPSDLCSLTFRLAPKLRLDAAASESPECAEEPEEARPAQGGGCVLSCPASTELDESSWAGLLLEAPLLVDELADSAVVAAWEVPGSMCEVPLSALPVAQREEAERHSVSALRSASRLLSSFIPERRGEALVKTERCHSAAQLEPPPTRPARQVALPAFELMELAAVLEAATRSEPQPIAYQATLFALEPPARAAPGVSTD
jgi:hypothetical protein